MYSPNIVVHDIKTAVYDMFWKNDKLYDNILLPECGVIMLRKWLYKMLKEDGMSDDEVEIIEYGLYCFLLLAVGVIAALAVGFIEGCMIYMVLFL